MIYQIVGYPGEYNYDEKWVYLYKSKSIDETYIVCSKDIDYSNLSRVARSNEIIQNPNSDWNWVSEANTFPKGKVAPSGHPSLFTERVSIGFLKCYKN